MPTPMWFQSTPSGLAAAYGRRLERSERRSFESQFHQFVMMRGHGQLLSETITKSETSKSATFGSQKIRCTTVVDNRYTPPRT
ncbi:hypothetical protein BaRGS_00026471 [Batillaria attramentaria]|uniref:Uncharacterized protein n=1 Tax=Batillaria attramentaria TaxID=370345 RepID=A0ABD0K5H5_9CAEN